jgi:AAA domain/DEAD/DEAH box helicase/Helicase conserved C-terminal domain
VTVRQDILGLLRDPLAFGQSVVDSALWVRALDEFAIPLIEVNGDRPLRPAQEAAWRGLSDTRAGLVLGPPGTGKTHLLAWLAAGYVWARRNSGLPCRVFVSAFTRNAIGHLLGAICRRMDGLAPDMPHVAFLGRAPEAGIDAGISCIELTGPAGINDATAHAALDYSVTGGTIWSLHRLIASVGLAGRAGPTAPVFDLVLLDEASQIVLGHGLMALAGLAPGGRVVVAGDDRQLPPIRTSKGVVVDGRDVGGSLYSFLKASKAAEFVLDETFRLNAPLTVFSERHFYPGAYRSAVPDRRLDLIDGWEQGLEDWERVIIDPEYPTVVLVHEGPTAATSNPFEAALTARLVGRFRQRIFVGSPAAFWAEGFAVTSPHRAQCAAVRAALDPAERAAAFIDTVDRIQGKERDVVLLSYAVADSEFALAEADFIFSPQRLNVAATRPRSKLIVLISRRLVDAIPAEQETLDQAEIMREFVFSCQLKGIAAIPAEAVPIRAEIRVRGFADTPVVQDIVPDPATLSPGPATLDPRLAAILAEIVRLARENSYGSATMPALARALARPPGLFADLRSLHAAGHISLRHIPQGARGPFWVMTPLNPTRRVARTDDPHLLARIEEAIRVERGLRSRAYYDRVRDRFLWMGGEDGEDLLLPLVDEWVRNGLLRRDGSVLDLPDVSSKAPPAEADLDPSELSDADFRVLNALEDIEAGRINFGIVEGWTSPALLASQMGKSRGEVAESLFRLKLHGYLLHAEDDRIRSRMAELAREIRTVKQRFQPGDAPHRPYLVRGLKLALRDRTKPRRDVPLRRTLTALAAQVPEDASAARGLDGIGEALRLLWGDDPNIAAFQARALNEMFLAWRGRSAADSFVIAADTGSGKTEAAALPLIAASVADTLDGISGTRAVLAYPRVRLAANQAQRLAGYLAAVAQVPGMPTLTVGLQVAAVPRSFGKLWPEDEAAGWHWSGPRISFPFFGCPNVHCGGALELGPGRGINGADSLTCTSCDWSYEGWVGSKEGLRRTPPTLFLPTTDSLHQWLHDPNYVTLFGDSSRYAPPRVIVADEIHLYSHIHGAQVAYALRRLSARSAVNDPAGRQPIAVGMSATLGEPRRAWARLIGREQVVVITPTLEESPSNPRGREYFYFVQPEIESRDHDVAGASTTIQTLMCLAHGMRRRTGAAGGYRALTFVDSIDKLRRLHSAYADAEESKGLAALRTSRYGDDPVTGAPRTRCCGEPFGCDLFTEGECWWFAATDKRQRGAAGWNTPGQALQVVAQPVFSGTSGRVDDMIKGSDIVFATSSLEVGYDDPNIALVYQHYAPQNLASFIQRKGRGGRGTDDRPLTAVTLSLYSPRDTQWFSRPDRMISPAGFENPINPDNHFVRRGQLLSAALDAMTRHEAITGETPWRRGSPAPGALAAAEAFVCGLFGGEPWLSFNEGSLADLFARALSSHAGISPEDAVGVRKAASWIPEFLFDTINLPMLEVRLPGGVSRREDILLAFWSTAPGNVTRRYDGFEAHWRRPADGRAPWLASADYAAAGRFWPCGRNVVDLLRELPEEARQIIDADTHADVLRPRQISLEAVGRFAGADWTASLGYRPNPLPSDDMFGAAGPGNLDIEPDSRGALRAFLLVQASGSPSQALPHSRIARHVTAVEAYFGHSSGRVPSGLAVSRVAWGADTEVRLKGRGVDPIAMSQLFTDPVTQRTLLHGYQVETEGVQFRLNSARLDAYVAAEVEALDRHSARYLHQGQWMRFLLESRAQACGLNAYDAQRAAELLASAARDPDLRTELQHVMRFWDTARLASLMQETRDRLLSQHPLMTRRRVDRTAQALANPGFAAVFRGVVTTLRNPRALAGYLRSATLHSLGLRLRQSFVTVAQGDERAVVMHAKLPLQFGEAAEDVITIAEAGAGGDGTSRAFADRFAASVEHWFDGFLTDCPNATEDALLDQFFAGKAEHPRWLALDPNDEAAMRGLADELGFGTRGLPAPIHRILYGVEAVEGAEIRLYDLAAEVRRVQMALLARLGREASAWEVASATVRTAEADGNSVVARLLNAYGRVPDVAGSESLTPAARLADQVLRIGTRLCADGCRACLHQASDLMADSLTAASVSRRLLTRFIAY